MTRSMPRPPARYWLGKHGSSRPWGDLVGGSLGTNGVRARVPPSCDCRSGRPLNRSRIGTVVVVPLTSNLQWADAPGNVLLSAEVTTLSKDSVANVSQIITIDKETLTERISKLPQNKLDLVYAGIDIILDR